MSVARIDGPELMGLINKNRSWPDVIDVKGTLYLRLEDGREYALPDNPIKFLGLLDHLAEKSWCDIEFIRLAIVRVASARGWNIHPF